ncbi:MAG: cysteine--tRNA ligase [Fimbriimonadaceae bacterium]
MPERQFKLFDTMTRTVKPLAPQEPGHLKFYSCGPTVYSYAHIGNFRTFLTADLVVRTAQALGWRVSYVSNITDVGHLTEDDVADAQGEDKMARALKSKEGQQFANVWDLAQHYADAFKFDWRRLNLVDPMVWPRATQHMTEQIRAIEDLVESGHAYATPTGVYFNLETYPDHGKLSGNTNKETLFEGVREEIVRDENKRHPFDFALWKKDDKHLMQWYSPWGWGFPGWHIECSVMAMAYLGETLDLHAGGEDLVFPHHESEIAQSECLTGKVFSNHWMHTRFLQVDGQKMSKSLGNYYTARDLIDEQGVDPLALRYALISVPYGRPLNFTLDNLRNSAGPAVERYKECARRAGAALAAGDDGSDNDAVEAELSRLYDEALDAMCDDLNTSIALAKAYEGTRVILRESDAGGAAWARPAQRFLDKVQALLGIVRPEHELAVLVDERSGADDAKIAEMIEARAEAKRLKDFARADEIRQQLLGMGVELRDTPDGTIWKRI